MSRMQISSPQLFLRNYSVVKNNSSPILRPTLSAFPYPLLVATYIHPRTLFAVQVCCWWWWRGGVHVQWRTESADHFHSNHWSCVFAWLKDRWGWIHRFKFLPFYTRRNNLLYAVHKEQCVLRGGKEKICGSLCLVWKFVLNLVKHAFEI